MKVKIQQALGNLLVYTFSILAILFALAPIGWIVLSAFKPPAEVFSVPPTWNIDSTLSNFRQAVGGSRGWGAGLSSFAWNSVLVSTLSTFFVVVIGAAAGYSMARFKFGGNVFPLVTLSIRILPPLVLLLPFYLLIRTLGWIDKPSSLILTYTAVNLPLAIWLARGFFKDMSTDVLEAALVDGCSQMSALVRVAVPMAMPGLVTIGILTFIKAWNEFIFALLLTTLNGRTLPVMAALFVREEAVLWGPMSALATMIASVPILLTIFLQRHIIRGLTAGAVKG